MNQDGALRISRTCRVRRRRSTTSAGSPASRDAIPASALLVFRSPEAITRFFDGFELVDPGLVRLSEWRADEAELVRPGGAEWGLAGVGASHRSVRGLHDGAVQCGLGKGRAKE